MSYYLDFREYLSRLEKAGKLVRVRREINKDTELMPLVRLQFRGLPEEDRRAFLFERVADGHGRRYSMPVVIGALAASREIYALGMGCHPEEVKERWTEALRHPIPPRLVSRGPVQEVIIEGDALERDGLGLIPIPISTPGYDNAPYTTGARGLGAAIAAPYLRAQRSGRIILISSINGLRGSSARPTMRGPRPG